MRKKIILFLLTASVLFTTVPTKLNAQTNVFSTEIVSGQPGPQNTTGGDQVAVSDDEPKLSRSERRAQRKQSRAEKGIKSGVVIISGTALLVIILVLIILL